MQTTQKVSKDELATGSCHSNGPSESVCLHWGAKGGLRGPLTGAQSSLMTSCAIHICQALVSLFMFLDVGVWGTAPEGVRDCHHRRCVVSQRRQRLSVSPNMVASDGGMHPMFHLICMGQGSDSDIDSQRPQQSVSPNQRVAGDPSPATRDPHQGVHGRGPVCGLGQPSPCHGPHPIPDSQDMTRHHNGP